VQYKLITTMVLMVLVVHVRLKGMVFTVISLRCLL